MPLILSAVDEQGNSYFSEVDCLDDQNRERVQESGAWQLWETKPGNYADFKPSTDPTAVAMMSGKLEVTVSSGEKRYFSRGETFLLQDVGGKGHAIRTVGVETCSALLIHMKAKMAASGPGGTY
jgi:uncharacterized cupin superfamily protein